MTEIGKIFIGIGILMLIFGVVALYMPKIPFIGRLPGDILVQQDNFTFYFPLATSIILSIVLSLLARFFIR